jgi:hypothetical protein
MILAGPVWKCCNGAIAELNAVLGRASREVWEVEIMSRNIFEDPEQMPSPLLSFDFTSPEDS